MTCPHFESPGAVLLAMVTRFLTLTHEDQGPDRLWFLHRGTFRGLPGADRVDDSFSGLFLGATGPDLVKGQWWDGTFNGGDGIDTAAGCFDGTAVKVEHVTNVSCFTDSEEEFP